MSELYIEHSHISASYHFKCQMINAEWPLVKHGVYSSIINCRTKMFAKFRVIFGILLCYSEIYVCLLHGFWRNHSVMFNGNPGLHRTAVGKSSSQPLTCIRNMEVTFPAGCGIRPFLLLLSVFPSFLLQQVFAAACLSFFFSFFINKVDPFCDPFVQRDPLFMMSLCFRTLYVTYSNYRGSDKSLVRPDWKKQLKGRHFSSDVEVIAAAETWLDGQTSEYFFFEWLAKVRVWSM